jgi:hypothetical protein
MLICFYINLDAGAARQQDNIQTNHRGQKHEKMRAIETPPRKIKGPVGRPNIT